MNLKVYMLLHRKNNDSVNKIRLTSLSRNANSQQSITALWINTCKLLGIKKSKIADSKIIKKDVLKAKFEHYTLNDQCKKYSSQFLYTPQLLQKRISKANKHFSMSRKIQLSKIEPRDKLPTIHFKIEESNISSKNINNELYIGHKSFKKQKRIIHFRKILKLGTKTKKHSKNQSATFEPKNKELGKVVTSVDEMIKNLLKKSEQQAVLSNIKSNEASRVEYTETLHGAFKPITDGDIIIKTKNRIKI